MSVNSPAAEVDDDEDDEIGELWDPALCLITGAVLTAGGKGSGRRAHAGGCTRYANRHGGGTGIFLLVRQCTVLLVRYQHAAYFPSIYVDDNGEEDRGMRRGKPLSLSNDRYAALEALYASHRVASEVARLRSSGSRVIIRDNYY
mmetsp:Transcript_53360/g.72920  ORF Transcript_53360/g.72920 Transcript_53360/m.72920 type:complete len:145 (+) Transcript_53360:232-666(+)